MPISRLSTFVLTPAGQFLLQSLGPLPLEQRLEPDPAQLETQGRAVALNLVLWPRSSDWRLYLSSDLMVKSYIAQLENQGRAVAPNLVLWPLSSERSSSRSPDWRLYLSFDLMIKSAVYEYIPHPTFYF